MKQSVFNLLHEIASDKNNPVDSRIRTLEILSAYAHLDSDDYMTDEEGLTAPTKVTVDSITERIAQVHFFSIPNSTTTVCSLLLSNGYVVIGKSACVDPVNFDLELGKKIAYEDAFRQIWALEGYRLREIMHQNSDDS